MTADGAMETDDFGRRLAGHRADRGLSQLQLGLVAGVSARHISFLETGRASPSRGMVSRLAAALGLPPVTADMLMIAAGLVPCRAAASPGASDAVARAIEIQAAPSLARALELARRAFLRLGLGHFFVGELTPACAGRPAEVAFRDTSHARTDWMAHYRQRGFRPHDPLVAATATWRRPFFWEDVLEAGPRPRRVRDMLGEAAAFGVTSGFVLPVPLADGRIRALSAMGEAGAAADPRLRWEARLAATAAVERPEFAA